MRGLLDVLQDLVIDKENAFYQSEFAVHQCIAVGIGEQKRFKDNILICDWVTLLKELGL